MKKFDLIAFICCLIVAYMIIGSAYHLIKSFTANFKFTFAVFLAVPVALALYALYNYFKYFK